MRLGSWRAGIDGLGLRRPPASDLPDPSVLLSPGKAERPTPKRGNLQVLKRPRYSLDALRSRSTALVRQPAAGSGGCLSTKRSRAWTMWNGVAAAGSSAAASGSPLPDTSCGGDNAGPHPGPPLEELRAASEAAAARLRVVAAPRGGRNSERPVGRSLPPRLSARASTWTRAGRSAATRCLPGAPSQGPARPGDSSGRAP